MRSTKKACHVALDCHIEGSLHTVCIVEGMWICVRHMYAFILTLFFCICLHTSTRAEICMHIYPQSKVCGGWVFLKMLGNDALIIKDLSQSFLYYFYQCYKTRKHVMIYKFLIPWLMQSLLVLMKIQTITIFLNVSICTVMSILIKMQMYYSSVEHLSDTLWSSLSVFFPL